MTTYQDPPLQSRRASRQGERPEGQPSTPFAPPQVPRTAAGAAAQGEPLSYVTQNRPPLPGYDTAGPRGRRSSEPAPLPDAAQPVGSPADAPAGAATPTFRPRDFSPEARTAPPAWAPENDRDNGVLDHHTQGRAAVTPPAAASLAASLASEPTEHTLSRRELRAIRDAHGITPPADTSPADTTPVVAQQPVLAPPAPTPQLDSEMAEVSADASSPATPDASRRLGRRAAPLTESAPEDGIGAFDAMSAASVVAPAPQPVAEPQLSAPQPAAPQPAAAPSHAEQHPVVLPPEPTPMARASFVSAPVVPEPVESAPVAPAQVESAPVATPLAAPEPVQPSAPVSTPTTGERPVGHWTNQADLDDAVQVSRSSISRTVGSASITTSALVLPSIPGQNMTTGEVMLTGSISLPSALSSTGAHSPIDESDIDHLLDPGDHQMVNTDSVPISAIRAVSSHTSTRGAIAIANHQPKKAGRALTVLIASASVMVVVVVTLLIVALATEVI